MTQAWQIIQDLLALMFVFFCFGVALALVALPLILLMNWLGG